MSEPTIYTFGYERRKPEELLDEAKRLDAVVIDVRWRPQSRAKGWNAQQLRALLDFDYQWFRDFGNENYKGGPVKLVDAEAGLEKVAPLIGFNLILLCYEADPADCHFVRANQFYACKSVWNRLGDRRW